MQPSSFLLLVKEKNYTLLMSVINMLLGGGPKLLVLSQKLLVLSQKVLPQQCQQRHQRI